MRKLYLLKTILLLCALVAGSGSVWADKTYKLTKVTSVSAGNKYVFEQDGYVMNNTVSSNALQCVNSYKTTGLEGTETYVWTLETVTGGFYMKNVSLNSSQYLNNSSSTNVSLGSKSSVWSFSFTNGFALIQNTSNSNRFLGFTNSTSHAYKAYATGNLASYSHEINVYLLEEEVDINSLSISTAPSKVRYEVGENLDMTGFELDADGESITSGYTMTIGGSAIENGDALNTAGKQTITISYCGKTVEQPISIGAVTSIEVTKEPDRTIYDDGESFDATGMVVTATLNTGENSDPDEWTKDIIDYVVNPIDNLTNEVTEVTITYKTKTTTQKITVKEKPEYTIIWMVNGEKKKSIKKTKGLSLTSDFPTPSAINGKTFIGWVTTSTVTSDYSGDYVNTATATATANTTYYAVFATLSEVNITDELTRETTGVSNSSTYSSWSNKKGASGAVYAGQSAGDHNSIQLRSTSPSGIISTTSGGKVKKVVIEWNSSTTEGRTLDIYGSNSAYTASSNLYSSSTQGTKLGSIVKGTSTELTITGDYNYVGMRSNSSAMYLNKVSITWESSGYTDFTTTPSAVGTSVTIGSAGYATFVYPYAVQIPTGVNAYVVTEEPMTTAKLVAVTGNIPANCPVVLKAAANDYDFDVAEGDVDAIAGNKLQVSDATTGNGVFVLANNATYGVGFYKWNGGYIGAGRVYLPAPAEAREFIGFGFEDEAAGVSAATMSQRTEQVYDLQGRRVMQPQKGLYIVNGKKVLVK